MSPSTSSSRSTRGMEPVLTVFTGDPWNHAFVVWGRLGDQPPNTTYRDWPPPLPLLMVQLRQKEIEYTNSVIIGFTSIHRIGYWLGGQRGLPPAGSGVPGSVVVEEVAGKFRLPAAVRVYMDKSRDKVLVKNGCQHPTNRRPAPHNGAGMPKYVLNIPPFIIYGNGY